jgi:hypothetical protein
MSGTVAVIAAAVSAGLMVARCAHGEEARRGPAPEREPSAVSA